MPQPQFHIRKTDTRPKTDTLEDALAILIDAAVNRDTAIDENGAKGTLEFSGRSVYAVIKMDGQYLNFSGTVIQEGNLRSVFVEGKVNGRIKVPTGIGNVRLPVALNFAFPHGTRIFSRNDSRLYLQAGADFSIVHLKYQKGMIYRVDR
jgi:hypothetical protein